MGTKRRGLWIAVSTKVPMSKVALEGSDAAFKLWVISMAHAREEQTAGDISPRAAGRLAYADAETAEELISLGAWHRPGHACAECPQPPEGKVQIHGYLNWQDSPEEIEARTAAGRKAARSRWDSDPDSDPYANRIQNENENENEKSPSETESAAAPARSVKRATAPPKWIRGEEPLPERIVAWLEPQGLNPEWVERQRTQMCDWALARGRTYKDWEAGFRNWITRNVEEARQRRASQVPDDDLEGQLREWLRVHPCPVPAELEAIEADDPRGFQDRMVPVRAAHRERGLAELRRAQMRSVR